MNQYEQHPFGQLYPEMEESQFQSFCEDIHVNGFQNPFILLYEGMILDGWHRYQAAITLDQCYALNLISKLQFTEYIETEPIAYVHSMNKHRRHLTQSQLAVIALRHTKMLNHGGDRKSQKIKASHDALKSSEQVAKETGTSKPTIERAKRAMNIAPEKIDEMVEGTVTPTQIIKEHKEQSEPQPQSAKELPLYPPLPSKKYDIIYADPPWDYKGGKQHTGAAGKDTGGAINHYPTLTLEKLKDLAIPSISDVNCLLFLWTTGTHLDQAIDLGKSWGFDYKQVAFVWDKVRGNPGNYTYTQCEFVLVFKRGTRPDDRVATPHQHVSIKRGEHSEKPNEIRDRIYTMYPGPNRNRIELFARNTTDHWDVWGNEV